MGEICNIFNIVKGVAPCEITCKRFNPRPGYGAAIVTLTSKSRQRNPMMLPLKRNLFGRPFAKDVKIKSS